MAKLGRYAAARRTVEYLIADKTLTAGDSGTDFSVCSFPPHGQPASITFTLPPAADLPDGWNCTIAQQGLSTIVLTSSVGGSFTTGNGCFVGNIRNTSSDTAAAGQISPNGVTPGYTKVTFSNSAALGGDGWQGDGVEITLAKGIYSDLVAVDSTYSLRHIFVVRGTCSGSAGILFSGDAD
jgi:hypothetical protein